MDTASQRKRSENMRRIRSRDTSPELIVRSLVHRMGYRYRLHHPGLPGKPDLVFPRLGKIIEVRGCFWHRHPGCIDSHIPRSNQEYWKPKLAGNVWRDAKNVKLLRAAGWRLLIVWACETEGRRSGALSKRLVRFLEKP
jgi:DNA mismatch endonuclease, patch repair protein